MRVRTLLISTALLSAILGGVAVYLAMTVPNDLHADAMLKSARKDLESGKRDAARAALSNIIQQYPRTDAAAAATVALATLAEQQRKELQAEIAKMRDDTKKQTEALTGVQQTVEEIRNAPPKVVVEKAPAPKPVKKRATTHRRRRRR